MLLFYIFPEKMCVYFQFSYLLVETHLFDLNIAIPIEFHGLVYIIHCFIHTDADNTCLKILYLKRVCELGLEYGVWGMVFNSKLGGFTSKNSITKHGWHSIPMFTTDMNVDIEC